MSNLFKRIGQKILPPDIGEPPTFRNMTKALIWMPLVPLAMVAGISLGCYESWYNFEAPDRPGAATVSAESQPAYESSHYPVDGMMQANANRYIKEADMAVDGAQTPEGIDAAYWGVTCGAYHDLIGDYSIIPDLDTRSGMTFELFAEESGEHYFSSLVSKTGFNKASFFTISKFNEVSNGHATLCPSSMQ